MFLLTGNNFTLNLEAVGIMLGILVSLTILLGLLVQVANKINRLESNIAYLKQELLEHSNLDGHTVLSDRLVRITSDINRLEKAIDLHVQDYINRKEFVQFMLGQLDEKVNHKFGRLYNSMKDMEKFLQKSNGFRVREYSDGEESD
ncbi:MAG: hypothetical protein ACRCZS_04710 [Chroococcidiopsis sp.]